MEKVWSMLKKFGITKENMIESALMLYVPHPGVETKERAKKVFEKEMELALSDPNILVLIYAGALLEEEGEKRELPLPHEWYFSDLTCMVADEVLGIAIAQYIGGTKGVFEYMRFDRHKPGILSKLGPFMDDVIGGLIGGVSANMYTRGKRSG